ncbi:cell division protein FtsQ [bacterium BMS3Abin04]|nr:cell division protein FtsQ [bacterium BMS3Abin04]
MMLTKKNIVTSSSLFFVLIIVVVYMAAMVNKKDRREISKIEISGMQYLPANEYLKFANLDDSNNYNNFDLSLIKDRMEKHPYVKYADVAYVGEHKVMINIIEKKAYAILIYKSKNFLVTEKGEIIAEQPLSQNLDLPIIQNAKISRKELKQSNGLMNNDIKTALRIIKAAELADPKVYENLSSINMRQGKDVIVSMTIFNFPVIFGRGKEVQKILYLCKLFNSIKKDKINRYIAYVDLRFDKHIYIGTKPAKGKDKGSNS